MQPASNRQTKRRKQEADWIILADRVVSRRPEIENNFYEQAQNTGNNKGAVVQYLSGEHHDRQDGGNLQNQEDASHRQCGRTENAKQRRKIFSIAPILRKHISQACAAFRDTKHRKGDCFEMRCKTRPHSSHCEWSGGGGRKELTLPRSAQMKISGGQERLACRDKPRAVLPAPGTARSSTTGLHRKEARYRSGRRARSQL